MNQATADLIKESRRLAELVLPENDTGGTTLPRTDPLVEKSFRYWQGLLLYHLEGKTRLGLGIVDGVSLLSMYRDLALQLKAMTTALEATANEKDQATRCPRCQDRHQRLLDAQARYQARNQPSANPSNSSEDTVVTRQQERIQANRRELTHQRNTALARVQRLRETLTTQRERWSRLKDGPVNAEWWSRNTIMALAGLNISRINDALANDQPEPEGTRKSQALIDEVRSIKHLPAIVYETATSLELAEQDVFTLREQLHDEARRADDFEQRLSAIHHGGPNNIHCRCSIMWGHEQTERAEIERQFRETRTLLEAEQRRTLRAIWVIEHLQNGHQIMYNRCCDRYGDHNVSDYLKAELKALQPTAPPIGDPCDAR